MIRNEDYIKQMMGEQCVLVAVGNSSKNFNGVVFLNKTSEFLWDQLAHLISLDKLAESLSVHYSIDKETALIDTREFVLPLLDIDAIFAENNEVS